MRTLINISNHPSDRWTDKQKAGWDKIIDIPFPNIDPSWDTKEVQKEVKNIMERLEEIKENNPSLLYLNVQGEYTLVYLFAQFYFNVLRPYWHLVVPTTERIVVEQNGEKVSKFEFNRWREI